MLIVYNIRKKLKIDSSMGLQTCPNCGHQGMLSLARERSSVRLFYILPILAWTDKRSYYCPTCGCPARYNAKQYKELRAQFPSK